MKRIHPKIDVTCSDCRKVFSKATNSLKKWSGRCRSCAGIFRTNIDRTFHPCVFCGETIPKSGRTWFDYRKRKFCDSKCQTAFRRLAPENNPPWKIREKLFCLQCQMELIFPVAVPPANRVRKFCSVDCKRDYFGHRNIVGMYEDGGRDYTRAPAVDGKAKHLHRVIAERALGRPMKTNEVVHHINGLRSDSRNSNLLICTNSYHRWLHAEMSRRYMQEHFGG